jgi:hypothetical protein
LKLKVLSPRPESQSTSADGESPSALLLATHAFLLPGLRRKDPLAPIVWEMDHHCLDLLPLEHRSLPSNERRLA